MSLMPGGAAGTGYLLSDVPNFGIHYGSGEPLIVAAQGSIYLRSDGSYNERTYINTDSGARWAPLIDDISGKVDIDHVGSGGNAHALAIPGPDPAPDTEWAPGNGLAGFISGPDQAKLNSISAGVGASINRYYSTPGATTWVKPANLVALEVWIQAGGGGGGGANAALGQTAVGGGGAGGGGTYKFYNTAALATLDPTGAGIAINVGAGGIGGAIAGGAGGAGSISSFGVLSTTGGEGGNTSGASTETAFVPGAAPGTGTGGDENVMGGPGQTGMKSISPPYQGAGGVGGPAALGGGGGWARTTNDTPASPGDRGSGGAGGYSANGGGGAPGGTGGNGYVKLREYY
jgi:hypothetical protein